MANISSQTSIDAFVRRLLGKEGKTNDDYMRYMQIALDALREFHIHHFDVEITKVVTVDTTTNTFSYPTDYVRYTMIGTVIDGRWWAFTRDDEMVPLTDDSSTTIQTSLPNIAEYKYASDLSDGGGYNRYYFRDDVANRRFQIAGFTPDIVILKYVTNGIDSTGNILIPAHALRAIENYVRWRIADYDDERESTILRLERQYRESIKRMRMAQRPNLQDFLDVVNSASSQLLRRG